MGWGSRHYCSLPGRTCSDNGKIQLWGLFPKHISTASSPLSPPFSANSLIPVKSSDAWSTLPVPYKLWLRLYHFILPQLIFSWQRSTKSSRLDTREESKVAWLWELPYEKGKFFTELLGRRGTKARKAVVQPQAIHKTGARLRVHVFHLQKQILEYLSSNHCSLAGMAFEPVGYCSASQISSKHL